MCHSSTAPSSSRSSGSSSSHHRHPLPLPLFLSTRIGDPNCTKKSEGRVSILTSRLFLGAFGGSTQGSQRGYDVMYLKGNAKGGFSKEKILQSYNVKKINLRIRRISSGQGISLSRHDKPPPQRTNKRVKGGQLTSNGIPGDHNQPQTMDHGTFSLGPQRFLSRSRRPTNTTESADCIYLFLLHLPPTIVLCLLDCIKTMQHVALVHRNDLLPLRCTAGQVNTH